jgi:SAM-dependent methyltransferase
VDILPEEVRTLAAKGYNVRLADVAAEPLAEQFEVIICGELLEHVEAPGRLFSSVTRMLQPGGVFVLTTPFPWYFGWMVKNLFDGAPPVGSVDHVAWYDPGTLAELADRHGLHLCFYAGVADKDPSARLRFAKSCLKAFTHLGLRPEILSRSVLYQFARERAL